MALVWSLVTKKINVVSVNNSVLTFIIFLHDVKMHDQFFLSHIAEDLKKLIDTFTWCEWSESAGMAALSPRPGRVRSHTKIFFLINDLPCYLSLTRALAGLIICMESRHYQDGMGANLKRYHIYICIKNISGRSRPTHTTHTHSFWSD